MSNYQEKLTVHIKRQKHSMKRLSKHRPDMAGILALSDQEFKTTVTNMLRALMEKANSMYNRWAI